MDVIRTYNVIITQKIAGIQDLDFQLFSQVFDLQCH